MIWLILVVVHGDKCADSFRQGSFEDVLTTATYDGRTLTLNGEVLGQEARRREEEPRHARRRPGVTAIHDAQQWNKGAFRGCTFLSSVLLLEGLTTIGNHAFRGCTSLSSISIPESVSLVYTNLYVDNEEDDARGR